MNFPAYSMQGSRKAGLMFDAAGNRASMFAWVQHPKISGLTLPESAAMLNWYEDPTGKSGPSSGEVFSQAQDGSVWLWGYFNYGDGSFTTQTVTPSQWHHDAPLEVYAPGLIDTIPSPIICEGELTNPAWPADAPVVHFRHLAVYDEPSTRPGNPYLARPSRICRQVDLWWDDHEGHDVNRPAYHRICWLAPGYGPFITHDLLADAWYFLRYSWDT